MNRAGIVGALVVVIGAPIIAELIVGILWTHPTMAVAMLAASAAAGVALVQAIRRTEP
jgi:hypothetical protein